MEEYGPAMMGVAVLVLMTLVQAPIAAVQKAKAGLVPGQAPTPDLNDRVYRFYRIHLNSVEMLVTMSVATFVAVFSGVAAWLVALLVWLHVLLRIAFWVIYAGNIGKAQFGVRTFVYVGGWAMALLLALAALVAGLL